MTHASSAKTNGQDRAGMKQATRKRFAPACNDEHSAAATLSEESWNGPERVSRENIGTASQDAAFLRRICASQQKNSQHSSTIESTEWDGAVYEIQENQLFCKLKMAKGSNVGEEMFATIPMACVDPDDSEMVLPGAIFRLAVGIEMRGGCRQQFLRLVFRRLPAWNQASMDEAYDRMNRLLDGINIAE